MLSYEGWINGFSMTISFIFSLSLGLLIMYKAHKSRVRLLFYLGFSIALASALWVVFFIDFVTILITGENFINRSNHALCGFITFFAIPIFSLISIYIGTELMFPEKKKFLIPIYLVLSVVYEIILILDPLTFEAHNLDLATGTNIILVGISETSIAMYFLYFFMLSGIIFCGLGYFIKSIQSEGVIRKKFLLLSTGYFIFPLAAILAILYLLLSWPAEWNFYRSFMGRLSMTLSFLIFYYGLREEPERKIKPQKEVKVKESLFRLTKLYENVDEERYAKIIDKAQITLLKAEWDAIQQQMQDESDWKSVIQYLYVIRRNGVVVYNHELGNNQKNETFINEDLLGGALSAITSIVKEIAKNESPLKVIQQQEFNILLEEGKHLFIAVFSLKDYKIIRQRMKEFLKEFQEFFGEFIDHPNVAVFLPAKKLVAKYFEL